MAKIRRKRYTVEGAGIFPVDMLRYDGAWPRSEGDSHNIITECGYVQPEDKTQRQVNLLTDDPRAPNRERWTSFGWRVTEVVAS